MLSSFLQKPVDDIPRVRLIPALRWRAFRRARGLDMRERARTRHAVVLERRRAYSRADEEVATAVGALLTLRLTRPSAR